jgi:MFS superfamily sulfate permease-like transporter
MKNLELLHTVCTERGTVLLLSHVSEASLAMMKKAGFYDRVGAAHFVPSIDAAFAVAAGKTED